MPVCGNRDEESPGLGVGKCLTGAGCGEPEKEFIELSDVRLTKTNLERVELNLIPKFHPWEVGRWKYNQ